MTWRLAALPFCGGPANQAVHLAVQTTRPIALHVTNVTPYLGVAVARALAVGSRSQRRHLATV